MEYGAMEFSLTLSMIGSETISQSVREETASPAWHFSQAFWVLEGRLRREDLTGKIFLGERDPGDCLTEAMYCLTSPIGQREAAVPWLRTALALVLVSNVPRDEEVRALVEILKVWTWSYMSAGIGRLGSLASLTEAGKLVADSGLTDLIILLFVGISAGLTV